MDFALSDELAELKERTERFVREQILPYENDARQTAHGPAEELRRELVGLGRRAGIWFQHELIEILPPTIFFFVGFNLIVLTTNLLVAEYSVAVSNFMLATAAALVVGKSVLVANAMPFLRRYDRAPLIQPIHGLGDFLPHMISTFSWHRFAAIQIWILVLFLIYLTASEFNHLFGERELGRILFTYRPSELQLNRRQRIRELVRLGRLADAHSVDEFRDPTSSAHTQLVDIVRRLARQPRVRHSIK